MKPRLLYRLEWANGKAREHRSQASALTDIVSGKPDRVIVETRNQALSEEVSGHWGSGLRAVAEEQLRFMRSNLYERAEARWGKG